MKTKLIRINTNKDYEKLVKNIKYYKSFLYYRTFFEIKDNINDPNINIICKALNIKKRNKRIDYVYDEACRIIDNSTEGINMCNFKNNKCQAHRKNKCNKINGCCGTCIYQTSKGCMTKNLACKLFYCSYVKNKYKTIEYKDLHILKLLSLKQRFIVKSDYFSTREDVLKDLYSRSLIYSTSRMFYRFIKRLILKKKSNKLI